MGAYACLVFFMDTILASLLHRLCSPFFDLSETCLLLYSFLFYPYIILLTTERVIGLLFNRGGRPTDGGTHPQVIQDLREALVGEGGSEALRRLALVMQVDIDIVATGELLRNLLHRGVAEDQLTLSPSCCDIHLYLLDLHG